MINHEYTKSRKYDFEELSNKIIKSAIQLHKELGPGFLESVYQKALPLQLVRDGIAVETQKEIKIYYAGQEVGVHILDIVADNEIIVELKTVKEFGDHHVAQVISYLKATGLKIGLLLNFAKATLDIKRVVY